MASTKADLVEPVIYSQACRLPCGEVREEDTQTSELSKQLPPN